MLLFHPAGTHLNLTVVRVNAIAYNKMVGQAILHAALAMRLIVDFGVAVFYSAVVDYNCCPIVRADRDLFTSGLDVCQPVYLRNWSELRDAQLLTN